MLSDGQLLSGGGDSLVKLWEPVTGQTLLIMKGHSQEVVSLLISPICIVNGRSSCACKLMMNCLYPHLLIALLEYGATKVGMMSS